MKKERAMRRVPLPRQARGEVSKVEMMERDRNVKGSSTKMKMQKKMKIKKRDEMIYLMVAIEISNELVDVPITSILSPQPGQQLI